MTEHKPTNNLIAIASGKGGVGKTWLAVTLASLTARSGRNVLLFDGDIGLANVDVQLGITPQKDLNSVMSGRHTLADSVMHYKDGGFDIIAGRSGSAGLASLPGERLEALCRDLSALARNYDLVLMDLGAGVESNVRYLASLAARCIVVVTDEPTSLTDAYAFIKLLLADRNPPEIQAVINQAGTQKEGDVTFQALNKACMNFLGISPRLLGIVRRDNKVKETIRQQKPLLARAPQCTAATDAAAIAIKLMQK